MAVEILFPGVFTTIQDHGRFGYQKSGISPSGVMDSQAYQDALYLVSAQKSPSEILSGQIPDAVLEATLYGPTLSFEQDTFFAITGADMQPTLDDAPVPMYETIHGKAGQTLKLGLAVSGCRTYIAFSGGILVPPVMGSRSTNIKCALGGYEGRALQKGDLLPTNSTPVEIRKKAPVSYSSSIKLRIIEGPQEETFTESAFQTLYHETYTVSELSDRMGYRLEGPALDSKKGVDIISDGITMGSIQVPPNGKPIILLADRQTTGGYAKIGTVYSKDLPKLVQLQPGGKINFERMDINELQ